MRTSPVLIVALVLGALSAPVAAFPYPLTVVVYATPEGAGVNETITVHIEVYSHGTLVHPDNVTAVATAGWGQPQATLEVSGAGVGRFVSTLKIGPEFNTGYRSIQIDATARLGEHAETGHFAYYIGEPGHPTGLYIGARVANIEQLGYEPLPGDTVVFGVHTHRDGRAEDAGIPIGYVAIFPYVDRFVPGDSIYRHRSEVPLLGIREGQGVYSFSYRIPPETNVSTLFEFHAEVAGAVLQPSAGAQVRVHPVPAILEIFNGSGGGPAARVCAAYRGHPVENATVAFGIIPDFYARVDDSVPTRVNRTTGPDGCTTVSMEQEGAPEGIAIIANVQAFGVTTRLLANGVYHDHPFEPQGDSDPPPHDLVVRLLSDTSSIVPGTEGTFVLSATVNGTPLVSSRMAIFAGPWYTGPPFYIGEQPTDANGTFSFPCPIPEGWTWMDLLHVRFLTEAGERLEVHINVGEQPLDFGFWPNVVSRGAPRIEVSHDLANHTVTIRAYPEPGHNTTGLSMWAEILPEESLFPYYSVTRDGQFPTGLLRWDGAAYSGEVPLPAWLWEGDYVVVAGEVSAYGFRVRAAEEEQFNWTTVHLTSRSAAPIDGSLAQPPEGLRGAGPVEDDPGSPEPPQLLGYSYPFWWLMLFVAAGSVAIIWFRRRPRDLS